MYILINYQFQIFPYIPLCKTLFHFLFTCHLNTRESNFSTKFKIFKLFKQELESCVLKFREIFEILIINIHKEIHHKTYKVLKIEYNRKIADIQYWISVKLSEFSILVETLKTRDSRLTKSFEKF